MEKDSREMDFNEWCYTLRGRPRELGGEEGSGVDRHLSRHPVDHGINVHARSNRSKYGDISGVQFMIIELSPL